MLRGSYSSPADIMALSKSCNKNKISRHFLKDKTIVPKPYGKFRLPTRLRAKYHIVQNTFFRNSYTWSISIAWRKKKQQTHKQKLSSIEKSSAASHFHKII